MAASSSRSAVMAALRPIAANAKASASTPLRAARAVSTSTPRPASIAKVERPSPADVSFPSFDHLPRPHGVHTATLTLLSYHPYNLDLYTSFAMHSANSLGIPTSNPAMLPTTKSLYTVLKGPFVHKKAQENFERKTHRRQIKVWDTDRRVVDLWLRYLKKNGVGGVGMKAEVFEWVDYGFSAKEREEVDKLFERSGALGGEAEIEKAAQELAKTLIGQAEEQLDASATDASSQAPAPAVTDAAAQADSQPAAKPAKKADKSTSPKKAEKPDSEKPKRTGGPELVEGSDDVVAGATLPDAQPESEAQGHAPPAKDGGEPAGP